MSRELLISSVGLALFIICPRMAGMVCLIAKNTQASLVSTALMGSVMAIPFVVAMVLVFAKSGLWGALAFCILTDLAAAYVMNGISPKAGLETLIIALFVLIGVKVAPFISGLAIR